MLMIWESLFKMLKRSPRAAYDLEDCRHNDTAAMGKRVPACYPCCCKAFWLECSPPLRHVRVRFARHNHLLGQHLPHGGHAVCPMCPACPGCAKCLDCRKQLGSRTLCTVWQDPAALRMATTLVVGTGSHLLEVDGHNESGTFARRADELADFLATRHPHCGRVVYLLSPWGELSYTTRNSGPTAPVRPHGTWAWDRIPAVNAEYARAMRAHGFLLLSTQPLHCSSVRTAVRTTCTLMVASTLPPRGVCCRRHSTASQRNAQQGPHDHPLNGRV